MKKIMYTAAIIASTVLSSCGGGVNNIDIPEGSDDIKALAEEKFGAEKEVYSFSISAKDHLTSEFGNMSIGYAEDEKKYYQYYHVLYGKGKLDEPKEVGGNVSKRVQKLLKKHGSNFSEEASKNKQVKIKDIDFDMIIKKYEEAIPLIDPDYQGFALYSWKYKVDNEGKISAEFTIEGTKKGEGTSMEGRNIVTNYYDFPFEMDAEGTLSFKD
jgi:hypothetical protein